MTGRNKGAFIKILVVITFLVMIGVNALANILPFNDTTTEQVSNTYMNLFAPTGLTFAIWGIIYLLLAAYTVYQLGLFQSDKSPFKENLFRKVGIYFSISSITNALWIFAWHNFFIALSMILMIVILVCLIIINLEINKKNLSLTEKIFIKLPFSIYFGWITVATIANATTLLVSIGWDGFGISEPVWTSIIIAVGLIIGIATIISNRDLAYGLVFIWAYAGILIRHTSAEGFAGQYPEVINTVIISLGLLLLVHLYVIILNKRELSY